MKKYQKITLFLILGICLIFGASLAYRLHIQNADFSFARETPSKEQAIRLNLVNTAKNWLGCKESDGSHKAIIDIYNNHTPLAVNYTVKYTDEWCATFVSTVAIQCGQTDIIPTECGCERQISLFQQLGCWQEDDAYIPLPGDLIYYAIGNFDTGNCTAWSNHVGIVVGTYDRYIKVIEGNYNQRVAYRIIPSNHRSIRGFGLPDYAAFP